MGTKGASVDATWIENEIYMLQKTLDMYKVYASNAAKQEQKAWGERIHKMEERVEEAKKRLEKANR